MTAPVVIDAIKRASAAIAAKRIYTKKIAEVPVTVGTQAIGSTLADNPLFKNPSLPPIPEQSLVPAPKPVDNQQSVPPGIAASAEPAKPVQNAPAPQAAPAVPPAQNAPATQPTPGVQQGMAAAKAPDNSADIARAVQPGVTPPTEAVTPDRIVNDYFIANKGAGISEKGITEYAAKTFGPNVDARSALAQHIQNKLLAPLKSDEKGNISFADLADARAKLLSIAKDPTASPEMKEWAQEAIAKESESNAARNLTPEQQKALQTQTFKKLLDYTSDTEVLTGVKQHLQASGDTIKLQALDKLEKAPVLEILGKKVSGPEAAADLSRSIMKSEAGIQAVSDKVLEEANKAANASAESINKSIDDLVEKDPKGSGFWDLLSSVDSASWGNIALVGGLVMMVFGGDTGKLIGGLSMLAGGYNLYQRYNQLQTPGAQKAFKAILEQSKSGAIDYNSLLKQGLSQTDVQAGKDIVLLCKLGLKDNIKERVYKKAQSTMSNFLGRPPAQPTPAAQPANAPGAV